LEENTTYLYAIRAYDKMNNYSELSETVIATTIADSEIPTNPSDLKFTTALSDRVVLQWSAAADDDIVVAMKSTGMGKKSIRLKGPNTLMADLLLIRTMPITSRLLTG
jgi:hypothetical protein